MRLYGSASTILPAWTASPSNWGADSPFSGQAQCVSCLGAVRPMICLPIGMERQPNDPIFARLNKERRIERILLIGLVLITVITWAFVIAPVVV